MENIRNLDNIENPSFVSEKPSIFKFIDDPELNSPFEYLQFLSKYIGNIRFEKNKKDIPGGFNISNKKEDIELKDGGEVYQEIDGKRVAYGFSSKEYRIKGTKNRKTNINILNIEIGNNFNISDFPKLIKQIQKNYNSFIKTTQEYKKYSENEGELYSQNYLLDIVESFRNNYKNKLLDILKLLEDPYFRKNSNQNIKNVWTKRAKFYYNLYLQYSPDKKIAEQEIKKIINTHKINTKFRDTVLKNLEYSNNILEAGSFSKEAKEYLSSDLGELFDMRDLVNFLEKAKLEINSFTNLEKKEKLYLISLIKLPKRKEEDNINDYIKKTLFSISKKLDEELKKLLLNVPNLQKKELQILESQNNEQMANELSLALEETLFKQANAIMWRLSSLPQTIKEIFSQDRFESNLKPYIKETNKGNLNTTEEIEKYFKENFSKQWENVEKARNELFDLRKKRKEEPNNKELIEKLSQVEKNIAFIVNEIIYSEKFIKYGNNFSVKGAYGKNGLSEIISSYDGEISEMRQQNCYGRTNIFHETMKNLFNIETKTGNISDCAHFFPVLELSNGELWKLDYKRENLTEKGIKNTKDIQELNNKMISIGEHEEKYKVGIYGHSFVYSNNDSIIRFFIEKAIKLSPNSSYLYSNIIFSIGKGINYKDKNSILKSISDMDRFLEQGEKVSLELDKRILFFNYLVNIRNIIEEQNNDFIVKNGLVKKFELKAKEYEKILINLKENNLINNENYKIHKKNLELFRKDIEIALKRNEITELSYLGKKDKQLLKTKELLKEIGLNNSDIEFMESKNMLYEAYSIKNWIKYKKAFPNFSGEDLAYVNPEKNWGETFKGTDIDNKILIIKKYQEINKSFSGKDVIIFIYNGLNAVFGKNKDEIKQLIIDTKKEYPDLETKELCKKIKSKYNL